MESYRLDFPHKDTGGGRPPEEPARRDESQLDAFRRRLDQALAELEERWAHTAAPMTGVNLRKVLDRGKSPK